jgi:hypothetical protein
MKDFYESSKILEEEKKKKKKWEESGVLNGSNSIY